MAQSRRRSIEESVTNIVVGLFLATIIQALIFRVMKIQVPFSSNVIVSITLTIVSLIRTYTIRRLFNARLN